ncbi:transmembrane and coiled-coil domains protein 1 isoform X2 [Nematostella vectensis]|uniref:transmembrane and coiled-coil domains protein 1 isoform X2 n=1 Tax=Nematostella vectensis TaxID=45351 RepID=UPI00207777AD|nr:transmembrane and coiled-coil domains protein 1 isoform X2 [Nematostella vectensis]
MSRSPSNSPRKKGLSVPGLFHSGSVPSLQTPERPSSPRYSPLTGRRAGLLLRRKEEGRSDGEAGDGDLKALYVPPERPKHFSKVLQQIRERARMPSGAGRHRKKPPEVQAASSATAQETSPRSRTLSSQGGALSSSGGSSELTRGRSNTALSITDEETAELDSLDGLIHDKENLDEVDAQVVDSEKIAHAIARLKRKIDKTKEQIRQLQEERDESVKEYLESTEVAPKQKVKTNFERKNQKTNATISQLQRKLQKYHKALVDLEENGTISSSHIAREVFKGVKDGVIGAVTKPLEIANLIKNRFGSSENVSTGIPTAQGNRTDGYEDDQGNPSTGDDGERITGSDSDNKNYHNPNLSPRYNSDDDSSSVASATHASIPPQHTSPRTSLPPSPPTSYEHDVMDLRETQAQLVNTVESMKDQMELLARSLQEQRFKSEHLQCQLNDLTSQWNDLTELHQNEMLSLKQELERAEERMECVEYRLSERAGEMEEALDSYVTRISKVEAVQQQNQQMVGALDEYLEQSVHAKALLSKFLSVVLAVLAIVLILFTTLARIIVPFTRTRGRAFMTSLVVIAIAVLWRYQDSDTVVAMTTYIEHLLAPVKKRLSGFSLFSSFFRDEPS